MEEVELVCLASQGDLSAFNDLVLKYQNQVFEYAFCLLLDYDAADEITQDAFILAFQKFYQLREGLFPSWLLKIVTNLCYDKIHGRKRTPLQPLEPSNKDGETIESPFWMKDPHMLPEKSIEVRELREGIEHRLSQMPFNFRIAVILVDIQELSYQEAAFAMSTSIGTLKSRLAHGRLMLRNALIKMDPDQDLNYRYPRSDVST